MSEEQEARIVIETTLRQGSVFSFCGRPYERGEIEGSSDDDAYTLTITSADIPTYQVSLLFSGHHITVCRLAVLESDLKLRSVFSSSSR